MGDAAKIFDWNGRDLPRELTELPPGRYRIQAVADGRADDDFVLTDEQEAGIEAAMKSVAEGRTVPFAEVDAMMRKRIADAQRR